MDALSISIHHLVTMSVLKVVAELVDQRSVF